MKRNSRPGRSNELNDCWRPILVNSRNALRTERESHRWIVTLSWSSVEGRTGISSSKWQEMVPSSSNFANLQLPASSLALAKIRETRQAGRQVPLLVLLC